MKEKPTSYNELLTLSTNLSNAAGDKKGVSNLVGAALLALTRIVQGGDVSDLLEHSMKEYLQEFGDAFVGGKREGTSGTALLPLPARLPEQKPVQRKRFRSRGSPKNGGAGLKRGWDAPKDGGEAPKEGNNRKSIVVSVGELPTPLRVASSIRRWVMSL